MNLKVLANQVFLRTERETPVKHPCEQRQKKVFHPESEMKHQMEAEKPTPVPFHTDAREPDTEPWYCPHCEHPVDIIDVFLTQDGRTLTRWSCEPCHVTAVTPDTVKAPPPNFEPIPYVKPLSEISPLDPATERLWAAVVWLEDNLLQPRRVGDIFAQWTGGVQRVQRNGALRWEGGRDGTDGHSITDLCEAQKILRVTAFLGTDGLWWWTCPETVEQAQERMNAA